MFETIKGGIEMITLFNKVKEWFDGKKAYTALIAAAIPPATAVFKDFASHQSVFQILASQEWNGLMLALGAIFIRLAVAKTDAKIDAVTDSAPAPK
jgi:hypothetical protein